MKIMMDLTHIHDWSELEDIQLCCSLLWRDSACIKGTSIRGAAVVVSRKETAEWLAGHEEL